MRTHRTGQESLIHSRSLYHILLDNANKYKVVPGIKKPILSKIAIHIFSTLMALTYGGELILAGENPDRRWMILCPTFEIGILFDIQDR